MRESPQIHRGDIFIADLSPCQGSEIGGHRPVLVVSNEVINAASHVVLVAPITMSRKAAHFQSHVAIGTDSEQLEKTGLLREGQVMAEHTRSIDTSRLIRALGSAPVSFMKKVDRAMAYTTGIHYAASSLKNKQQNKAGKADRLPVLKK